MYIDMYARFLDNYLALLFIESDNKPCMLYVWRGGAGGGPGFVVICKYYERYMYVVVGPDML
jgi:hypothetical protein